MTLEPWTEHAFRALRDAGYRAGGARSAVVEALGREGGGMSAQELSDRLRGAGREVGFASVYRALGVLSDVGLVRGLDVGDAGLRYELVRPGGAHHHHLVCERCGRTATFEDRDLEGLMHALAERVPYTVDHHDVILRGACPTCAAVRARD